MGGAMKISVPDSEEIQILSEIFRWEGAPGIYEIYRKGGAECARWACLGWAREYCEDSGISGAYAEEYAAIFFCELERYASERRARNASKRSRREVPA